ncbi:hypothetical protein QIT30_gp36 [Saccharolobus solfataricus rod-shaped virus 1]|uniref:Uncharacterized protein n=1 Tax=Saccharolobus solfataricus rod-shaped virus 1 TaxID=2730619 RepID=A0A6M3VYJ2_SSRV1|nr:hypothetical protein QIT30_gp36 [Saccharolobus solfataricus rod-shaped virus 1]QJF12312.1 hypothetical protein SSRV1_gp36 [Saccharolobus solfataricus rod-shaped virus 1]
MARYEKEIGNCKIKIYKYNDKNEIDQYAEIYPETENLIRIDIFNQDIYAYSKYATLSNFLYAQSFAELEKYPASILGLLIWGD